MGMYPLRSKLRKLPHYLLAHSPLLVMVAPFGLSHHTVRDDDQTSISKLQISAETIEKFYSTNFYGTTLVREFSTTNHFHVLTLSF